MFLNLMGENRMKGKIIVFNAYGDVSQVQRYLTRGNVSLSLNTEPNIFKCFQSERGKNRMKGKIIVFNAYRDVSQVQRYLTRGNVSLSLNTEPNIFKCF